jgi:CHAT domain-containing protein/Tfp pilus assembly protein PilF
MPPKKTQYCQKITLTCLIIASNLINSPLKARDTYQLQTATPYLLSQEDTKTRADRLFQEGSELLQQRTAESLQQALIKLEEVLSLYQQLKERFGEGMTLNQIGAVYSALGKKQIALEYYQQALSLWREDGDRFGEARSLNNIGAIYNALGENQKALEYYQQALPLLREADDKSGEAYTLNNIGFVYSQLGESQKALEFYQQALRLRREAGDKSNEATTLNNIGAIYNALGENQKALEYYQQALPLLREANDKSGEAYTLNNIGVVYNALGESQKALEYHQQALPLRREAGDKSGEANTLHNIGVVYSDLGESQKALEYYQQALSLLRETGNRFGEAYTLTRIGDAYNDLGENQKALEYFQQALPLRRAVGDLRGESITLYNIAVTQKETGNLQESLTNIEASISIIEDLRTKIVDTDLRQSYFASVQSYYQFYIDLLMELDEQNPNSGYDAKAFNASERMRGRSLLELLTEANTDIRQGVDPTLLQQEKELNQKLDTIEQRRVQAYTTATTQTVKDEIEKERLDLISQYKTLQTQIRSNSPRYANLKQPQPIELKQLQEQILDTDTVLLQYSLGEERSFLWVITKEEYTTYELPKRQIIEDAAKSYHGLVSNLDEQKLVDESAIKLSDLILKQAAAQLSKKRIVIVGDGALLYVPFQSLPLPNTANKNLLQNYEIINLPSSSTIAILREDLKNRKTASKSISIFADPIFNTNDSRITKKNTSNNNTEKTLDELALDRSARNSDVNLERLLGTRQEAEVIAKLFPENNRVIELDFEANRTNATSKDLNQYKILHFATHGLLNSENPELSGIVMSLFDTNGNPVNGYLRLNDIFNLSLNADLVVLSACETGLGKEVKGEGLIGLTRGFMYAGASRLVISLWSVDDAATAELMSRFYTKMLKENLSPQVALRQAQLEIQQIPQWSHPFFWAGFVIQGEWE